MTQRVDELPPCSACGGKLFPLVLCETCGTATILRDAEQLDWAAACSECGTFNPWQLICDQCHNRFPAPGHAAEPPPAPADTAPEPELATGPKSHPTRRIRGEFDTRALLDMLKVLGLDPSRGQALIDRGYDALWKIARAKEDALSRIPEIGPVAARKVVESLHLLNYSPPQRTKESIAQDVYECPLCGCVTSVFAPSCVECGAAFDEEEMDETIRREFAEEGDAALLAFYDARLADKPDDADVAYARGLLLESLGRIDEAIEALDRAAAIAPEAKKIRVAALRAQGRQAGKPEVAAKLRATASTLLDDVAWDQEVAQLDQLISTGGPTCPQCGSALPKDAALCPSCGTRLSREPARGPASAKPAAAPSPELDTLVDDLLVGELEESLSAEELERTKAAVLDWLIEELEDSMAPEEKEAAPPGEAREEAPAESSPLSTSVGFLSGWMRGSRGLVSGLRPKRGARGGGKVNGLVNGQGRVNGLVNGVGRVNGLVNGVGRVNGLVQPGGRVNGLAGAHGHVNGVVNGTRFVRSGARGLRLPTPSRRVRYATIASAVVVAVLIFASLFIPIPGPSTPIVIDGSFGDWSGVPMFDAATVASDANVSIARYAELLDGNTLYLFASTRGRTLGNAIGYDAIYFLVDADGNPATGYAFDGIGADAVVDVYGGDHRVAGALLYSFPTGAEVNWSQRQGSGSAIAAASSQGLEVQVSTFKIARFDAASFRVSVYANDFRGASSRSKAPLTATSAAVLLETQPLTTVVGSGPTALFDIHVRGLGTPASGTWLVSNLTFAAPPGVVISLSAESVTLTQGQPDASITAFVSAPGFFPGDSIDVNLTGGRGSEPVFVRVEPVRAYVIAPPSSIRIDGLFADWSARDLPDADPVSVNNPNVDILRSGAAISGATAFFHVQVAGTLLNGGIPEHQARPPPNSGNGSSGNGAFPPRQTGEDLLLAYIDANASDAAGLPIGGIFADYLVEIRGEAGRITSEGLFAWSNRWIPQPAVSIAAAKNETDIEASLPLASLIGTRMVFESTDWSSTGDLTDRIGAPSFSPRFPAQVGTLGLASPQADGFAGETFYLRDNNPGISPSGCSTVRALNTTESTSGQTVVLTANSSRACFFTDPALSSETIPAGTWSASLDLTISSSTVVNVSFAVTDTNGASPTTICWQNRSDSGGDNRTFTCSGNAINIQQNDRIRLQIEYISGSNVTVAYSGNLTSQDSSLTIPIPEFDGASGAAVSVGVLVLIGLIRRKRRLS